MHIAPYIYRGPLQFRIWEEKDPHAAVVAIKHYINTYEQERTIWMDGRPHPPEWAPHTWRVLDRQVGGRHPGRHDDPHQVRSGSAATAFPTAISRR